MLDKLKKEDFTPHLNSAFEIHPQGGHATPAELVEVTEKKTDLTEMFSLIFRGPKDHSLPQGSHTFKHPQMGEMDLFITPIMHAGKDGQYYQAVFNRLIGDPFADK